MAGDEKIVRFEKQLDAVRREIFGNGGDGLRDRMIKMEINFKNSTDVLLEKLDVIHKKQCIWSKWVMSLVGGIILVLICFVSAQLWKIK